MILVLVRDNNKSVKLDLIFMKITCSPKHLLRFTSFIEISTGLALAIAPTSVVEMLLGSRLDSPASRMIARVLGSALISLGTACWLAWGDAHRRSAAGLITAMLLYNVSIAGLLFYSWIGLRMAGVGLLPAVILHSTLAAWCLAWLRTDPLKPSATL